jgi:hypothetical protein
LNFARKMTQTQFDGDDATLVKDEFLPHVSAKMSFLVINFYAFHQSCASVDFDEENQWAPTFIFSAC